MYLITSDKNTIMTETSMEFVVVGKPNKNLLPKSEAKVDTKSRQTN